MTDQEKVRHRYSIPDTPLIAVADIVGMLPTFVRENARLFSNRMRIGRGSRKLQLSLKYWFANRVHFVVTSCEMTTSIVEVSNVFMALASVSLDYITC